MAPPRHMLMAQALRGAADQADSAAQTPDMSVDMDSMANDADAAAHQLECPKCHFTGLETEFELPAGDQPDSPDPGSPAPDDQGTYQG